MVCKNYARTTINRDINHVLSLRTYRQQKSAADALQRKVVQRAAAYLSNMSQPSEHLLRSIPKLATRGRDEIACGIKTNAIGQMGKGGTKGKSMLKMFNHNNLTITFSTS
jgi:hypothetical protein